MVALAISALLAGLSMPSFSTMIARCRVRHAGEQMAAALYLARAEALRRGGQVTLARASSPGCVHDGLSDWSCGWAVFADPAHQGMPRPGARPLQRWPAPKDVEVTMHAAQPTDHLPVNRWGRFGHSQGFSIKLRSRRHRHRPDGDSQASAASEAQVLCISAAGRLRTAYGSDRC